MFTPGSRACAYRTASGRAKWLNRDPIGELGFRSSVKINFRQRTIEPNPYGFVSNRPINSWDLLGLADATIGEIVDIITEIGPIDAASISGTPGEAEGCVTGMSGLWGGEADAVRHCTWLCLMSKKLGSGPALAVAGIHEKHHPPPTPPKPPSGYGSIEDWKNADNGMDNANNQYGAQLGRACGIKDCCSACKSALKQGQLKVNSSGGYKFGP